ncbi:hypothetical protein BCR34DRAFT_592959 [Clohesyomyces aquaticus]|uniref:Uncharacterized protein n=1 Tax=Clohesyomyces aquaticus TaxID=1231657 RepID=A0A1Y1YNP6_9PLEO|nr:hypothetical protein BCR34DRAFT_592959 [Clohesyomyces aquaticus]
MNCAVDIYRQLNEPFLKDYPDFVDYWEIIRFLYNGYMNPASGAEDNAEQGRKGWYDLDGVVLSPRTLVCEVTTKHYFEEYITYTATEADLVFLYWDTNLETGTFLGTFIDMHCELGNEASWAFARFKETSTWALVSMKEAYEFGKTCKCSYYHELNGSHMAEAITKLEVIFDDSIEELEGEWLNKLKKTKSFDLFLYHKMNPLLCGLLLQRALCFLGDFGAGLASDDLCVLSAIHLYNGALWNTLLPPNNRWSDLEYVVDNLGESHLIVGKRPDKD